MPIVGPPSTSPLKSRNSTSPKAIPTSQSAAPHVARRESLSGAVAAITAVPVATAPHDRCSQRLVPHAANRPRYHSSRAAANRYIAMTATASQNRLDNADLSCKDIRAGNTGPVCLIVWLPAYTNALILPMCATS